MLSPCYLQFAKKQRKTVEKKLSFRGSLLSKCSEIGLPITVGVIHKSKRAFISVIPTINLSNLTVTDDVNENTAFYVLIAQCTFFHFCHKHVVFSYA